MGVGNSAAAARLPASHDDAIRHNGGCRPARVTPTTGTGPQRTSGGPSNGGCAASEGMCLQLAVAIRQNGQRDRLQARTSQGHADEVAGDDQCKPRSQPPRGQAKEAPARPAVATALPPQLGRTGPRARQRFRSAAHGHLGSCLQLRFVDRLCVVRCVQRMAKRWRLLVGRRACWQWRLRPCALVRRRPLRDSPLQAGAQQDDSCGEPAREDHD